VTGWHNARMSQPPDMVRVVPPARITQRTVLVNTKPFTSQIQHVTPEYESVSRAVLETLNQNEIQRNLAADMPAYNEAPNCRDASSRNMPKRVYQNTPNLVICSLRYAIAYTPTYRICPTRLKTTQIPKTSS